MKKYMAMLFVVLGTVLTAGEIPVKSGETIAFLGDSITQQGDRQDGYLTMTMAGLKAVGIDAKKIGAGVGGHKSDNMLKRVDKDVISKKPQWMVLSCGVNDVWHQSKKPPAGIDLETYKKNITEIIEKAQAANIKVIIMTATMITENAADGRNVKLADYNAFLRETATAKGCIFADQHQAMLDTVAAFQKRFPGQKKNFVTTDGVHMNPLGNKMMAVTLLKALGLDAEQLAKAEQAIAGLRTSQTVSMTVSDYEFLNDKANEKKASFSDYAGELFQETMKKERAK